MQADLDALKQAYEDLKAQPQPVKGVLKAVGKEGDGITPDEKPMTALEAIKKAHQNPIRIT